MSLEERLERLERAGRTWRMLSILLGTALLAVLSFGQARPNLRDQSPEKVQLKQLACEGLYVLDKQGNTRCWINVDDSGPSLMMYDKNKSMKVLLSCSDKPDHQLQGLMLGLTTTNEGMVQIGASDKIGAISLRRMDGSERWHAETLPPR